MSKHWEELTSRDGKFNGNNLYRDEKTKKLKAQVGRIWSQTGSVCRERWLSSRVLEVNALRQTGFFVLGRLLSMDDLILVLM